MPTSCEILPRHFWGVESGESLQWIWRRAAMKRFLGPIVFGAFFLASGALIQVNAQAQNAEAEKHVAAAKAVAFEPNHDFTGAFETICAPPGKGVGEDGTPLPGAGGNSGTEGEGGGAGGGRGGAAGGGAAAGG